MTTTEKKVDTVDATKAKEEKTLSPDEEAARTLNKDLRQVEAKRRLFRRTLIQYDRIKKRFTGQLEKLAGGATEDKSENPEKDTVVAIYRLVRNFCISYNTHDMLDRNEDKQVYPKKFAVDIESALGSQAVIDAFAKALKAEKAEESTSLLPAKIDATVTKKVTTFLEKHDKSEITSKLEKELEVMSTDIDKKREDLKAKRAEIAKTRPKPEARASSKDKPAAKKSKKAKNEDVTASTEERFRDLIKEVN